MIWDLKIMRLWELGHRGILQRWHGYCRLQELQEQMVGGEAVGNSELKERRKKKQKHAEEKRQALAGKHPDQEKTICGFPAE